MIWVKIVKITTCICELFLLSLLKFTNFFQRLDSGLATFCWRNHHWSKRFSEKAVSGFQRKDMTYNEYFPPRLTLTTWVSHFAPWIQPALSSYECLSASGLLRNCVEFATGLGKIGRYILREAISVGWWLKVDYQAFYWPPRGVSNPLSSFVSA